MIPKHAKYFLTEEQITDLHKKEVWQGFVAVGSDYSKLPLYQQEWFKMYFSLGKVKHAN